MSRFVLFSGVLSNKQRELRQSVRSFVRLRCRTVTGRSDGVVVMADLREFRSYKRKKQGALTVLHVECKQRRWDGVLTVDAFCFADAHRYLYTPKTSLTGLDLLFFLPTPLPAYHIHRGLAVPRSFVSEVFLLL